MRILALLLLAVPAVAQESPLLSVPGVTQAVATYAKSMKAVGISDMNGKLSAGGFLPVRTIHDGAGTSYFSMGIGGVIKQGEHFRPRAMGLFDLSAITRRIENRWGWYSTHVEKLILPDFWVGPNIILPMPGDRVTFRDFKDYLGVSLAVGW